ncbi:Y-family DNA polymerase [Bacillus cereus]|uniref:Y-family DNA polymerase n=1 Tax=Bacillus cereus TaxID=1396 RepID=UPI0018CCD09E|nr:DNA repair protein [Bacillus cereus]MBG9615214.1 DNA repair protein [Bacillus cereus]
MYDYSLLPNRMILCVDLVSFYASVSSIKMGYDPLHTKVAVVGDTKRSGSIVLAATPPLKQLGKEMGRTFTRLYELPKRKDILLVNPMMETYIKCSNYISNIALQYVAPCDFFQMSIDEFFLEMDASLHLFASDPYEFAKMLQQDIYKQTRITCAIAIGPSPLMSKLCLDLIVKRTPSRIAQWTYEDVAKTLWNVRPLSKFYGISTKTEQKLHQKGIHTIEDLAKYPLKYLKQTFGPVMGTELHLHSWGIDFSRIRERYSPKTISLSKNQTLLRDYEIQELPILLLEHIEEICYRMRCQKKMAQCVQLSIGYSKDYGGGIRKTFTLSRPTCLAMDIYSICLKYILHMHTGEPIRSIHISLSKLLPMGEEQLSLFDDVEKREKQMRLAQAVDDIRTRFGKNSLLRAISFTPGATTTYRNSLMGGHRA